MADPIQRLLAALAPSLLIPLCAPGGAWAISSLDVFPLELGNSWTYLEDGGAATTTITVVGTEIVNGTQTFRTEEVEGPRAGTADLITNDLAGVRVHKQVVPDPEGMQVYDPPVPFLPPDFEAGTMFMATGTSDITITGSGTFRFDYEMNGEVIGLEQVTVPLGTFDAYRVDVDLLLSGPVTSRLIESDWYVPGMGIVKFSGMSGNTSFSSELTATNVPEPSPTLLGAVGMLSVVALAARRRL